MNCAICGKDNQAGTRFCVHCGAALAAPAGGSQQSTIATAGAILGPKSAATLNAPAAASLATTSPTASGATPVYTPRPTSPPPPPETTFAAAEAEPAPAIPAYNAEPKRAAWVVIAIAVAGAVAIGGYFGYKVVGGPREAKDTLTRNEVPQQPAPATSPAKPAETSPGSTAPSDAGKSQEAPPAVPQESASTPAPSPAPVVPPKVEPKAPRAAPSGQSTSRQPATPPVALPPTAPAPQPPARVAQPSSGLPAAAPAPDRWAQFAEDLHRCERETFLSRVICDQRVRLRYCDGYWGKVPQCPGGVANPDRGQ